MLSRTLVLKASGLKPVEKIIRRSFLFRPVVSRFIAGDTLEEALASSAKLLETGLKISLDYLGENTATEAEALAAKGTYIAMLDSIASFEKGMKGAAAPVLRAGVAVAGSELPVSEPLNISIKLTQCGLDQGVEFCEENLREVLWCAEEQNNFVRLDMEGSDYTEATLTMLEKVFHDFKNTGTVLQSYLFRTDEDVERIIKLGARCRLVKGAYLEPANIAYKEKTKVDEAYIRQAKRLLDAGFYPAIATQDEGIVNVLNEYVEKNNIPKSRFEYQMLYGIRRDLQDRLLKEGYNVRIYVPFGDRWYPYFTRRLAERPANIAFIVKSFLRG